MGNDERTLHGQVIKKGVKLFKTDVNYSYAVYVLLRTHLISIFKSELIVKNEFHSCACHCLSGSFELYKHEALGNVLKA